MCCVCGRGVGDGGDVCDDDGDDVGSCVVFVFRDCDDCDGGVCGCDVVGGDGWICVWW